MSVPEHVRRAFSTMFVTKPPYYHQGADDYQDPDAYGLHVLKPRSDNPHTAFDVVDSRLQSYNGYIPTQGTMTPRGTHSVAELDFDHDRMQSWEHLRHRLHRCSERSRERCAVAPRSGSATPDDNLPELVADIADDGDVHEEHEEEVVTPQDEKLQGHGLIKLTEIQKERGEKPDGAGAGAGNVTCWHLVHDLKNGERFLQVHRAECDCGGGGMQH